jgi:hypothetical protein
MKFWMKVLVPVLVLGLVGIADAKGKKGAKEPAIMGKIVSVAGDGSSIVVKEGKKQGGADVTVPTAASTKVTIDGAAGKAVSDLKAGEKVSVKSKAGTAKSIKAKTPKAKKHHKKK